MSEAICNTTKHTPSYAQHTFWNCYVGILRLYAIISPGYRLGRSKILRLLVREFGHIIHLLLCRLQEVGFVLYRCIIDWGEIALQNKCFPSGNLG